MCLLIWLVFTDIPPPPVFSRGGPRGPSGPDIMFGAPRGPAGEAGQRGQAGGK